MIDIAWRGKWSISWGKFPPEGDPLYWYLWLGPIEVRWILGKEDLLSIDFDRPNKINRCLRCDAEITPENDSGWEGYAETGTQPICIECDKNPDLGECFRCSTKLDSENSAGWLIVSDTEAKPICKLCYFTRHHWIPKELPSAIGASWGK